MEARNPAIPIIQFMASWNRPDNQTSFASSELVIPGQCEASNPESRDSPMCNCTSEVWSFGPSRNDGARARKRVMMISERPIGIAGAGSIGCFVGGMYAAAGRRVALLARPRVIGEIESNGLRLTSFGGLDRSVAPNELALSAGPPKFGAP